MSLGAGSSADEVPQNLRAMAAGGPVRQIVMMHRFNIKAELLGQIQNAVDRNCRMILHKETLRLEEF